MLRAAVCVLMLLLFPLVRAHSQEAPTLRVGVGPSGTRLVPFPSGAGFHALAALAWTTRWSPVRLRAEGFLNQGASSTRHRVLGLSPGLQWEGGGDGALPYAYAGLGLYVSDLSLGDREFDPGTSAGAGLEWPVWRRRFLVELSVRHYGRDFGNGGVSPTLWSLSVGARP